MSVAQIMLSPDAVGLGVMDAFVCRTPMITTECGNHAPEITYLEGSINGVVTANELYAYVDVSVRLLRDVQALDALRADCAASAQEYTVENMALQFVDGIECVIGR